MTKRVEVSLDSLPPLVQYVHGREGDGVPSPGDDLQPPDQGQAGGQELQQVLVQQQHLQYSTVQSRSTAVKIYFILKDPRLLKPYNT